MNLSRLLALVVGAATAACYVEAEPPRVIAYAPPPNQPAPPPPPPPRAAPPPPQPSGASLGCFKDQGDPNGTNGRDLDGLMTTVGDLTNASCVSLCASRGFKYAGTQYATQCFCGNSYGRSGPSAACNYKCGGNPGETCGGFWANSVYEAQAGAVRPAPPPPPRN